MYGWGSYRGFGVLDYYGLLAQAHLQNCDPMDSTCVTNNVAKEAAVEDLWVKYQTTGAPDDLKLNFTPLTAAQVRENYDPDNPAWGGNVIDTRGIMSVTSNSPVPSPAPAPKPAPPPPPAPIPAPRPLVPVGRVPINSSGVQNAPSGSVSQDMTGGVSLPSWASAIPWWGWLAGAGGLYFAFGGRR